MRGEIIRFPYRCIAIVLLSLQGVSCFSLLETNTRQTNVFLRQAGSSTTHSETSSTDQKITAPPVFQGVPMEEHNDDVHFRRMRNTLPIWTQHWLRDSGMLGFIADTLTRTVLAPAFYQEHPQCFADFLRVSGYPSWVVSAASINRQMDAVPADIDFSIQSYGSHQSQYAEVMVSGRSNKSDACSHPLLCFVHGGAWGSGFPTMYRLISVPFLEKGYRVAILGYRTYPDATVDGQVDDIAQAIRHLSEDHQQGPTILMGHSSGAHVSLMAAVKQQIPSVDGLICMSGVYDIEEHFGFETAVGVEEISPMSQACGVTVDSWRACSPNRLIETVEQTTIDEMPPLLFLHGELDTTASPIPAAKCYEVFAARVGEQKCKMRLLQGVDHAGTVLETLLGGRTQDAVFEWLDSCRLS